MPTKKHGVVEISEDIDMDGMLARLPLEMRNKAARKAVKKNVDVVTKAYKARVTIGETGNLKKSIRTIVRDYRQKTIWYGLAGATKPTGNHMHLVEQGHDVFARGPIGDSAKNKNIAPQSGKARVEGKFDLVRAIDTTKTQRDKAVIESLADSIKKAGG